MGVGNVRLYGALQLEHERAAYPHLTFNGQFATMLLDD